MQTEKIAASDIIWSLRSRMVGLCNPDEPLDLYIDRLTTDPELLEEVARSIVVSGRLRPEQDFVVERDGKFTFKELYQQTGMKCTVGEYWVIEQPSEPGSYKIEFLEIDYAHSSMKEVETALKLRGLTRPTIEDAMKFAVKYKYFQLHSRPLLFIHEPVAVTPTGTKCYVIELNNAGDSMQRGLHAYSLNREYGLIGLPNSGNPIIAGVRKL